MEGGGRVMAGGHFKIFKQVTGTKKKKKVSMAEMESG